MAGQPTLPLIVAWLCVVSVLRYFVGLTSLELLSRRAIERQLMSLLHTPCLSISQTGKPPGGRSSSEEGMGRGDVVEIYGGSGSGKTELLMNVIAQHVLPAWLGGEEQTAFFFDNGKFDDGRSEFSQAA